MSFLTNWKKKVCPPQRVAPIHGSEAMRQTLETDYPGVIGPTELHTTSQNRLFLAHHHIGGWANHGIVATEAAMLALNTTSPDGCWPGDVCTRMDTRIRMLCVNGHGTSLSDWEPVGGAPLAPVGCLDDDGRPGLVFTSTGPLMQPLDL